MSKKNELGKGLKALIANIDHGSSPKSAKATSRASRSGVQMLDIAQIEANPTQPRKQFDEEQLQELAESIAVHGIIQPITVRKLNATSYQIISGERRYRAAKRAKLDKVPVYIRTANDQELVEMALIENIQRSDLNPLEVAFSYERLLQEFDLTHDALANRVSKDRSSITNHLRLIKLHPKVQQGIRNEVISLGHAKILAGIKDAAEQSQIFDMLVANGLSVRALELLLKKRKAENDNIKPAPKKDPHIKKVEDNLSDKLGTRVFIKISNDKGQLQVPFRSIDHLNHILDQIGYDA